MLRTLRTDQLAAAPDRFAVWETMVVRDAMLARVHSRHANDFVATLRAAAFGAATFLTMEHPSLEVERTHRHIRESDPELVFFTLNLAGRQRIEQDRNNVMLEPGALTLFHSSRPMRSFTDPAIEREAAVLVAIPTGELGLPADRLPRLLGTAFPGDRGLGAVVSAHLRAVGFGTALADPIAGPDLARVTVDLISVLLARQADVLHAVTPEVRERALMAKIESFIRERLGDLTLSSEAIAAAHHLSLRSLQRLFRANGSSVAGLVRQLRLERCLRDLADPALASVPVATIGRRWGFADGAHFGRLFKSVHGMSPAAFRAASVANENRAQPRRHPA